MRDGLIEEIKGIFPARIVGCRAIEVNLLRGIVTLDMRGSVSLEYLIAYTTADITIGYLELGVSDTKPGITMRALCLHGACLWQM